MRAITFDEHVPSDRRPGRAYRITGSLGCECSGFATHGRCKHLRRFLDTLLAPKAANPRAGQRPEARPHGELAGLGDGAKGSISAPLVVLKKMADDGERAKPKDAKRTDLPSTKTELGTPILKDLGYTKKQSADARKSQLPNGTVKLAQLGYFAAAPQRLEALQASQRATARTLGVTQMTVSRDLVETNVSPETGTPVQEDSPPETNVSPEREWFADTTDPAELSQKRARRDKAARDADVAP